MYKSANLHSNKRRSGLEMCVSYTQWLPKPSHQVQGPYNDIEWKQVTCDFFWASWHVCGHQMTTHRPEIRLKKRHCAIPVSNLIVLCTSFAVFSYDKLWRETKVMIAELISHAAANFDAMCKKWACYKHAHLQRMVRDVVVMWFFMAVLTICLSYRELVMEKCWYPIFRSVWPSATHLFHIRVTVYEYRQCDERYHGSTLQIGSLLIRAIKRYIEQSLTLQSAFQMRNPLHNFSLMQCFRCRFSFLFHLYAMIYKSLSYPNRIFNAFWTFVRSLLPSVAI